MTHKSMRSFAGGIIVAASMCGAVYYFGPSEADSAKAVEKPSIDEMKSTLISEGYVIHSKEEWQKQEAAIEAAKDSAKEKTEEQTKENGEEKTEEKSEEVKEKIIYRTMISVTPGMTSIDVGKALERANIIDSGMEFFKEVEKQGLSKNLRPGTYEVESEMTMKEIISIIFK
ncbi:endolytic transglycosylase MltG [Lederbergia wuyishanensis]|uniref:Mannitol-specific phosphotransferase system IIBC component n=1 Tax=Lederbergia wuyishanensis TaxID=1347903 RepID=A0ABU0D9L1_9BACI|nr:endolytic transglycosylase MltG [Lederbergia wuyishanensis]MCJ8007452.1 endolytic transglycosylase MltG [Lederbergia wuyishanensis]MDQ0345109.1 mannitol-specific phosphotransferase system IIBC component [Lederbergia wuyishanensis]